MGRSKKILALLLAVALLLTGMPMDILLAKGETKSTTKEGQELKKSSSSKSINVTDEQTKEKATSPAILPGATDPKKEEKSSQTIIDTAPKAEEKKSNVELVDDTPEAIEKVQTKDDATDKVDEASQPTQAEEAKESEKAEEVYKGENLNAYLSADNYKFEAKKDDQGGESLTDYIMSFSFKTEDFIKAGDYITVEHSKALVKDTDIYDLKLTYQGKDVVIAHASYDYNNSQLRYEFTDQAAKFPKSTIKFEEVFHINNKLADSKKEVEVVNTVLGADATSDIIIYGVLEEREVVFEKLDENKKPIEKAIYALEDENGKEVAKEETGKDGKINFGVLPKGTYSLKEVQAPQGYQASDETWEIFVDKNGATTFTSSTEEKKEERLEKILDKDLLEVLSIKKIKEEDKDDAPSLSTKVKEGLEASKLNIQSQISHIDWDNMIVEYTTIVNPQKYALDQDISLKLTNKKSSANLNFYSTSTAIYEVEQVQVNGKLENKLVNVTSKYNTGKFAEKDKVQSQELSFSKDDLKEKDLVVKTYTSITEAAKNASKNFVEFTSSLTAATDKVTVSDREERDVDAAKDEDKEVLVLTISKVDNRKIDEERKYKERIQEDDSIKSFEIADEATKPTEEQLQIIKDSKATGELMSNIKNVDINDFSRPTFMMEPEAARIFTRVALEDSIGAFAKSPMMSNFASTLSTVEATGSDVGKLVTITAKNVGYGRVYTLKPNSPTDNFVLDLGLDFNDNIKAGDWFTITMPIYLRPESISDNKLLNITDMSGNIIAEAQYDGNNKITYVFTSYMVNYKSVKGVLKQPFNINPDQMYFRDSQGIFFIAGDDYTRAYTDYYSVDRSEFGKDGFYRYANMRSAITEVDHETGTFTTYIHVNPKGNYLYSSTLNINIDTQTSPNSAILNSNTSVEVLRTDLYYPDNSTPYNLGNLTSVYGPTITNKDGAISINFGNKLSGNYDSNYNRYVVKVIGKLDELGNPISINSTLKTTYDTYYNNTDTVSINNYYSDTNGSSSFTGQMTFQPIDFTINKVNENNEALVGSTFKITGDNGYSKEIVGTNLSSFKFEKLPLGHYIIEEMVTPEGYKKPASHWQFTINKDELDKAYITTPDFPMEIKTDDNVTLGGKYPNPYDSLYSDLVRNPLNYTSDIVENSGYPGEKNIGTLSKRITDRPGTNIYQVEVVLKVNPNQKISSGNITDTMGNEFNVDLGLDNGFAREDFSLTASDGSFLYIENPESSSFVSGGEPFATDKVLSGSKIYYDSAKDSIIVDNLNFSTKDKGAWIKLTYNVKFDFETYKSNLDKNTFYETGKSSGFSWLDSGSYRKSQKLPVPSIRPVVHGEQRDMAVTVINFKEDANLEMKKVGEKRTYGSEGKFTTEIVGLQGAQFELYKASENDPTKAITTNKKFITNAEGQILFQNLQRDFDNGKEKRTTFYWIKELSSPNGYERAKDLIGPFIINYDGTIDYEGTSKDNVKKDKTDGQWHIENKRINHLGELDIYKKAGDKPLDGGKFDALPGAIFTLYWVDGTNNIVNPLSNWDKFWNSKEIFQEIQSAEDGRLFFKDLKEGYYRLEETKPAGGYVKTNTIWQVYVNDEGITKLVDVTAQKPSNQTGASIEYKLETMSNMDFLLRSFSPMSLASGGFEPLNLMNILGENRQTSGFVNIQDIDPKYHPDLYKADNKEFSYTGEQENFTGFKETYKNPKNTTGLYTFDGSYKESSLPEVAGVNKYITPTGRPGEYTVHVRVKGNRTKSNLGVVIVYDNSNSMQKNPNSIDRLNRANEAITNFTKKLVSPGSEETKVALVTYGSELFPTYSTYNDASSFTNDPNTIVSKLPKEIPAYDSTRRENQGGTYTQGAIEKAQELLKGQNFDNKVIITVSDGVPTYSNLVKYIDSGGKYVFDTQKTGTGNRFIDPYTHNYYNWITNLQQPYQASYNSYWVEDRSKTYDPTATYASSAGTKYYFNQSSNSIVRSAHTEIQWVQSGYYDYNGRWVNTSGYQNVTVNDLLPNNGYGYKLISNHGYATIDSGKQIKDAGTQMYTIGIQIGASNISGSYNQDASRSDALEVMFGISSSKDTYFDAQNLDYLDVYLNQILAELEEQNPPTINNGTLIDPMGEMVLLGENEAKVTSIKSVGSKKIPTEVMDLITTTIKPMEYTKDGNTISTKGIELNGLNLGKDQEIELTYKVHLNTEDPRYIQGKMYDTNGPTTLQPNGDYDKKWNLPIPSVSGPVVPMELAKQWQKADGTPPESTHAVKVQLQRKLVGQDNDKYVNVPEYDEKGKVIDNPPPKEVTQENGWKIEYKNLIPFDKDGNVYEYRILEVNPDGAYTILYEGNGYSSTIINRERVRQDVVNKINEITFVKKDSKDQSILPNVEFELKKDDVVYNDGSSRNYGEIYTNQEGKLEFKKLPPGNYELIELTPLNGYKKPTNPVRKFKVGEDGVIKQSTGADVTEDFKTILNEPTIVEVKLTKIDGDTKENLAGAKFKLYKGDQITEVIPDKVYVSAGDGTIDLGSLRAGQYYLEEIETPSNKYQKILGKLPITIQVDGTVLLSNDENLEIANYKEVTTEIGIKKVERNSSGGLDGISGATFKITDKDGGQLNPQPDTSQVNGSYGMFTQLREGEYRIVESNSPLGYIRFQGYYTFEVKAMTDTNGKKINYINWIKKYSTTEDKLGMEIYNKEKNINVEEEVISVSGSDRTSQIIGIQVINEPNKLVFKKVDGSDNNPLAEVKFGLYYEVEDINKEFDGKNKDGETIHLRATKEGKLVGATDPNNTTPVVRETNDQGKIIFDKMRQRYDNLDEIKYYIKETETKDGYQILDYYMGPFTAKEDGIYGPNGKLITSDQEIVIDNFKRPDLQITKVDALDKYTKLAGAEFELYKATKNDEGAYQTIQETDKVGKMQITSDDGLAKFEKLEEGLYWLRESKAPQEYVRILKDIGPFLVEKGKIYKVELDISGKIKTQTVTDGSVVELRKDLTRIENTSTYKLDVENTKAQYPGTGSIGTNLFFLIGLSMMSVGFVWMYKKKRDENNCRVITTS